MSEIITPPAHLPVTVAAADMALAAAVDGGDLKECNPEWRAIVAPGARQNNRGWAAFPPRVEIGARGDGSLRASPDGHSRQLTPKSSTRPATAFVSRDPHRDRHHVPWTGRTGQPQQRSVGSFPDQLTNAVLLSLRKPRSLAGDAVNKVPASIQLMVEPRNRDLGPEVEWAI